MHTMVMLLVGGKRRCGYGLSYTAAADGLPFLGLISDWRLQELFTLIWCLPFLFVLISSLLINGSPVI